MAGRLYRWARNVSIAALQQGCRTGVVRLQRCAAAFHEEAAFHARQIEAPGFSGAANMSQSSRRNQSRAAVKDDTKVFSQGSFKLVYRGHYTEGTRKGETCVLKELRSGPTWLDSVFDDELAVVERTADLVDRFNKLGHIDKPILVNRPEVWYMTRDNSRVLCEPFIKGFEKFNSNTGWANTSDRKWAKVMQALSHYSYHCNSGQYVLCDLQGAVYRRSVVITDPVVHSRKQIYGPTDMGVDGILQFFDHHYCNEYCCPSWQQPKRTHTKFPVRSGTSMVGKNGKWIVPTRESRPQLDPPRSRRPPAMPAPVYEEEEEEEEDSDCSSDDWW